jgi:predicted DNA-binding transcriptional regulator AlpA
VTDQLVGIPEIGQLLGVSRQRASKIIHTVDDFPEPLAHLSGRRIWFREDIEKWAQSHPRRPGRLAKKSAG